MSRQKELIRKAIDNFNCKLVFTQDSTITIVDPLFKSESDAFEYIDKICIWLIGYGIAIEFRFKWKLAKFEYKWHTTRCCPIVFPGAVSDNSIIPNMR